MANDAIHAMAQAHKAVQVRSAARVQAALSALWDRTLDPSDLTGSFLRFREQAVQLILGGRGLAEREADEYYRKLAAFKGHAPMLAGVPHPSGSAGVVKAQLSGATGRSLGRAAYVRSTGGATAAALAAAKSQMLGAAKRTIIQASRDRLTAVSRADHRIKGWARVSDGDPCAFCAMLCGRGPVYSDDTVDFIAHARCGCNARLVYWDDPDGGWSDEAQAYREAYEQGVIGLRYGNRARGEGDPNAVTSAAWEAGFDALQWLDDWIRRNNI